MPTANRPLAETCSLSVPAGISRTRERCIVLVRHQVRGIGQDGGKDEAFPRFHELDDDLPVVHAHAHQTDPSFDQDMQEIRPLPLAEQNGIGGLVMNHRVAQQHVQIVLLQGLENRIPGNPDHDPKLPCSLRSHSASSSGRQTTFTATSIKGVRGGGREGERGRRGEGRGRGGPGRGAPGLEATRLSPISGGGPSIRAVDRRPSGNVNRSWEEGRQIARGPQR